MKTYTTPELWLIRLLSEDVIATSDPMGPFSGNPFDVNNDGWGNGNQGGEDIFGD